MKIKRVPLTKKQEDSIMILDIQRSYDKKSGEMSVVVSGVTGPSQSLCLLHHSTIYYHQSPAKMKNTNREYRSMP